MLYRMGTWLISDVSLHNKNNAKSYNSSWDMINEIVFGIQPHEHSSF